MPITNCPLTLDDVLTFPPLDAWRAGATAPDLSHDGRWIAYAHQGYLWLVDVEGRTLHPLTEGDAPRWSPATNVLAFLRGQTPQIWISDAGENERQLTFFRGGISQAASGRTLDFAWSPEGHRIASLSPMDERDQAMSGLDGDDVQRRLPPGYALWLTDVATGDSHPATHSAPGVSWSSPTPRWSGGERLMAWRSKGCL